MRTCVCKGPGPVVFGPRDKSMGGGGNRWPDGSGKVMDHKEV